MDNKWALEEHFSTAENNKCWDSAGEAARDGKILTDYVESRLLDVDGRVRLLDATGIGPQLVSNAAVGHRLAALGIDQRASARWQRREEIFS